MYPLSSPPLITTVGTRKYKHGETSEPGGAAVAGGAT